MMFRSEPVSDLAKFSLLPTRILMALGTNRPPTEYFFTALGMAPCSNIESAVSIVGEELYVIVDAGPDNQVLVLAVCSSSESFEAVSETHGRYGLSKTVWAGDVVADFI
jgi:hypothetical protein